MRSFRLLAPAIAVIACAAPASASVAAVPVDVDVYTTPPGHTIVSECELSVGYTTDPRFVTYVVRASASAGGPSTALATSVRCTVYDPDDTTRKYGGASRGRPGPHAEAVGQAVVPVTEIAALCVTGGATYLDGTTIASTKTCP